MGSWRHATVLFEQSQANLRTVAEGLGVRLDRVEFRLDRPETGEVRRED